MKLPPGVELRPFGYGQDEKVAWRTAHSQWWPACKDPSVYGRFQAQAACGRYSFSSRDQPRYGFGEVLVGHELENEGFVCWSSVKLFRPPERSLRGYHGYQTRVVENLLRETTGLVPQEEYRTEYYGRRLRLKNIDVVGFHFGRRHWVFAEVKVDRDRLHPRQTAALSFLRRIFSERQAAVFVATVRVISRD